MKSWRIKIILFLLGYLTVFPSALFAETITLSTYYPAPFGSYDRLKLVPRDSLPRDPHCNDDSDLGVMYYDNGLNEKVGGVYVCLKTSEGVFGWVLSSGVLLSSEKQPPTKGKVVCAKEDGSFGVCMNNPSSDGTCGCQ